MIKVDKKIVSVVGQNKNQLPFATYYCYNIVKITLKWSYSNLFQLGLNKN